MEQPHTKMAVHILTRSVRPFTFDLLTKLHGVIKSALDT